MPEDTPTAVNTRGDAVRTIHTARNNQAYPTYGEIICALWDGRSGEARLHYQIFNSSYHIRIHR